MLNTNSNKTSNETSIKTLTYNLLNCLFGLEINKRKGQTTGEKGRQEASQNEKGSNSYKQSTLAPTKIEKDELSYETVKYLAAQLENPDIKNIAVTGPYGSGKSSVLRTLEKDYLKSNSNYKYLNISLATLKYYEDKEDDNDDKKGNKEKNRKVSTERGNEDNGSSNPDSIDSNGEKLYDSGSNEEDFNDDQTQRSKHNKQSSNEKLNRLIEYSILQQLIYKEKTDKTPNSRIKRIVHVEESKLRCTALRIILFVFSLIILFEPQFIRIEWMYDLLSNEWLNKIGDFFALCFLLILTFSVLVSLSRKIPNSTINKLNLKTVEIELSKNASIFNKYLDEILYFFQATEYNVIIFEDLDRFNTPEIFLKLRELNTLLNIPGQIDRKIVFIYAVRDDLFVNTDRCKCFDYIVPIIPFINSYNSRDMLKKELERTGYADIDDEDLKNIAFYISDMRLVKNIANEYQQYRNILEANLSKQNENKEDKGVKQEREQNPESLIKAEKLLAMIVFKNYYPKEFSDLHYYKGKVFACFKLRDKFIDQIIIIKKDKSEKSRKYNQLIDQKILKAQSDLRLTYLNAYKAYLEREPKDTENILTRFKINDSYLEFEEIAKDGAIFNDFITQDRVIFLYKNDKKSELEEFHDYIPFYRIQEKVNPSQTYRERLEELNRKFTKLKIDIGDFDEKKERFDLNTLYFKELMERNSHRCYDYRVLKIEPMIESFLIQGYIDENYYDYLSLFHGEMILPQDWKFILDLKNGKSHSYDYSFANIESCIDYIISPIYKTKPILNIEILDYWVGINEKKEKQNCQYYIECIKDTAINNNAWGFFVLYYQEGTYSDLFFTNFSSEIFFENPKKMMQESDDNKEVLIEMCLKYTNINFIPEELLLWLELNYSFLIKHLDAISLERIELILNERFVEFVALQKEPTDLLDYIIETHKFQMNIHNINLIADYLGIDTLTELNLTSIKKAGNDYFINKIENHLDTFLNLISQTPASKKESKEVILEILQNEKLNEETKSNYLLDQENSIELDDISELEYQTLAIKLLIVSPTWDQVYRYYKLMNNTVTEELSKFIAHFANKLKTLPLPKDEKMKASLKDLTEKIMNSQGVNSPLIPIFERQGDIIPQGSAKK